MSAELTKWLRENSSGVYRKAAEAADVIEEQQRQLAEQRQELRRWKSVAVYLANCHAANAEGTTPAVLNDYDKSRFTEILEKAVSFLRGGWPPHNVHVNPDEERVAKRCEEGIERLMGK